MKLYHAIGDKILKTLLNDLILNTVLRDASVSSLCYVFFQFCCKTFAQVSSFCALFALLLIVQKVQVHAVPSVLLSPLSNSYNCRSNFLQNFVVCSVCKILKKSSKSKVEVPCAPSVLLSLLSNPIRSRATGVIGLLESIWNHLENISDFFLAIFAYLWNKIEKILSIFLSLQFVDYAVKIPADADVKFCSVCHYNVVALSS